MLTQEGCGDGDCEGADGAGVMEGMAVDDGCDVGFVWSGSVHEQFASAKPMTSSCRTKTGLSDMPKQNISRQSEKERRQKVRYSN